MNLPKRNKTTPSGLMFPKQIQTKAQQVTQKQPNLNKINFNQLLKPNIVTKNDYSNRMPPSYKTEQRNQQNSLLNEPDKEKKRLIIQQLIDSMNFQDFSLPNDFNEKEWNYLLDCKAINELKITLRYEINTQIKF